MQANSLAGWWRHWSSSAVCSNWQAQSWRRLATTADAEYSFTFSGWSVPPSVLLHERLVFCMTWLIHHAWLSVATAFTNKQASASAAFLQHLRDRLPMSQICHQVELMHMRSPHKLQIHVVRTHLAYLLHTNANESPEISMFTCLRLGSGSKLDRSV